MSVEYDTLPPKLTAAERQAFDWACGGIEPHDPNAAEDLVEDLLGRLEQQAATLVPGWQHDPEAKAFAQAAKRAARKVRALHSRQA